MSLSLLLAVTKDPCWLRMGEKGASLLATGWGRRTNVRRVAMSPQTGTPRSSQVSSEPYEPRTNSESELVRTTSREYVSIGAYKHLASRVANRLIRRG